MELLRQQLDFQGIYSPKDFLWQHLENITYIVTVNESHSMARMSRFLKHFHVVKMEMPSPADLFSIFSKLLPRHFLVSDRPLQVKTDESGESSTRVSTGKSSSVAGVPSPPSRTTTPTTGTHQRRANDSSVPKPSSGLSSLMDKVVRATVELNERMRHLFETSAERVHYVFSMKQLNQLFLNLSFSLNDQSSSEEILSLWHHELDWLYGKRLSYSTDSHRYEQLYKTIVKKYFTNMFNEQQILLTENQLFSNLYLTESGLSVYLLPLPSVRTCPCHQAWFDRISLVTLRTTSLTNTIWSPKQTDWRVSFEVPCSNTTRRRLRSMFPSML